VFNRSRVDRASRSSRVTISIAGFKGSDSLPELRAMGAGSARHFSEHLTGPGGFQGGHLGRHALAVRRDPRVSVNHAGLMAVFYATEKGSLIKGLNLLRKS
jgi:hypothetical protein